jgi:hypothetical protein
MHEILTNGYIPVEDPITNARVGLVCGVFRLSPVALDLLDQALGVLLCALLRLITLEGQVVVESLSVPAVVGSDDLVVPVVLDQDLEIFAI